MNTKPNLRYVRFVLIALAITLATSLFVGLAWRILNQEKGSWDGQTTTLNVEATVTPVPAPDEKFPFNEFARWASAAARETCILPVWLADDDMWRKYQISQTAIRKITDGQMKVTYVAIGKIYINDRVVEFAPASVEVFQEIPNAENVYELNFQPYVERATEILGGDVAPWEIIATWTWMEAKMNSEEYEDFWYWGVTNTTCTRLSNKYD